MGALERMDQSWTELLQSATMSQTSNTNFFEDTPFEQLLVYFLYRHLADADMPSKAAAFSVLSVRMIQELCKRLHANTDDLIEICRLYSSEIEYSEANTAFLTETCFFIKK